MRFGADLIWQLQGEPLGSVVEQAIQTAKNAEPFSRFVHIVNLYLVNGELPVDQRETVRAIARAQRSSSTGAVAVFVSELSEREQVESAVASLGVIAQVVAVNFAGAMPRVSEILQAAYEHTEDGDYFVFANADICPVPAFYDAVAELLIAGSDALVVNRRSVFGFWPGIAGSSLAAFSVGAAHPGFDCFVFARVKYSQMIPSSSVVGSPYVMLSVLCNLVAVSTPLVVLTDAHLTYHFGDDRAWQGDGRSELVVHNLDAAQTVCDSHDATATERLRALFGAFPNWNPAQIKARL